MQNLTNKKILNKRERILNGKEIKSPKNQKNPKTLKTYLEKEIGFDLKKSNHKIINNLITYKLKGNKINVRNHDNN